MRRDEKEIEQMGITHEKGEKTEEDERERVLCSLIALLKFRPTLVKTYNIVFPYCSLFTVCRGETRERERLPQ